MKSRKLFILYLVLTLSTIFTFIPPILIWILSLCWKPVAPLMLLSSTEWVSIIVLTITTYFGANVYQKNVMLNNGILPNELNGNTMINNGMPGGGQVQQQQQINVNVDVNQDEEKEKFKEAFRRGEIQ